MVLQRVFWEVGQNGSGMVQFYVCGNLGVHANAGGGDINAKANAIGFHGPAYQFDTAFLNPQDGTYVELTSQGAGNRCTIRYKRHEKVEYTVAAGGAAFVYSAYTNNWALRIAGSDSATGATKNFNRHHTISTADFGNNVMAVAIP
jgi:hypothetical protein